MKEVYAMSPSFLRPVHHQRRLCDQSCRRFVPSNVFRLGGRPCVKTVGRVLFGRLHGFAVHRPFQAR
jgi:hypothetical protein